MQVGEEDLPGAQVLPFRSERLLHLHDHLGAGEDFGGRIDEFRPGAGVFLVRRSRADAGAFLHDRPVAVMDEFRDRSRRHADAEFVVLDLLGNADEHGCASLNLIATIMAHSRRDPLMITDLRLTILRISLRVRTA